MAVKMVREPSETPNISNIDDFVGLRYAYGNQNGYVINKLNECSYETIGNTFKINSGRLVIQGVEIEIDANGFSFAIDSIATKRFYSVYLEINLETMSSSIKSSYDTAGYPIISEGDDLTKVTNGIAKMLLYTFDATSGIITNVQKRVNAITYSGTPLVGYNNSKGTIETRLVDLDERLEKLGFRSGVINFAGSNYGSQNNTDTASNGIFRQGNYVFCRIVIQNKSIKATNNMFGIIPELFRPKNATYFTVSATKTSGYSELYGGLLCRAETNGTISQIAIFGEAAEWIVYGLNNTYINFGYEAPPIE